MMGRGDSRNPSYDYNGYNGDGGKGIDKMIDQLIAKHDGLLALSTKRRLLFFHRSAGPAVVAITHRAYPRVARHVALFWERKKPNDETKDVTSCCPKTVRGARGKGIPSSKRACEAD
jgi:hypothetical protein